MTGDIIGRESERLSEEQSKLSQDTSDLEKELQQFEDAEKKSQQLQGVLQLHEKRAAEIKAKGVTIFDAPPDYADAWIKASKKVLANFEAKDAFFKKVMESQRAFASVVVPYTRETSKLSTLISAAAEVR